MDSKQTRRFLIVAFAISLLIHAIAMLFVRWPAPPKDEVQVVHLTRMVPIRIARIFTPPPPTPTPQPSAAPTLRPPAHHAPARRGTRPVALPRMAPPAPPSRPEPTPRASATPPSCLKNDTPVTIAASPSPPDIPADARTSTAGGIARVQVNVQGNGSIAGITLAQSSGTPALDAIALAMAQHASFTPATHLCRAVAATYTYSVRFVAW